LNHHPIEKKIIGIALPLRTTNDFFGWGG